MNQPILLSIVFLLPVYLGAQDSLKDYKEFIEYVEPVDLNNIEVHNQLLAQNLSNIWALLDSSGPNSDASELNLSP